MKIQRETSYLAPAGEHTGTIANVQLIQGRVNGKDKESIRVTIVLDPIPRETFYEFRARVDYYESQVNEFVRDAKRVLGNDDAPMTNIEGEIKEEHLAQLLGSRVKFIVTHEYKPGHPNAYRRVENLRPDQKNP